MHPSPRLPQHVNPFYIEPSGRSEWDGDWIDDDDDDDGDLEEEGLLDQQYGSNGHHHPHRHSHRHRRGRDDDDEDDDSRDRWSKNPVSNRSVIIFLVLFAIVFVVLSLSGGNKKSNKGQHHGGSSGSHHATSPLSDHKNDDDAVLPGTSSTGNPTRQIIVLGERHSGVPWLVENLPRCFGGGNDGDEAVSVSVRSGWTREGYWFQDPADVPVPRNSSVIVYAVRDPHAWVEMMRRDPIHAPGHYNRTSESPLPWREFLDSEWSMERPDRDYQQSPSQKCQLGFMYDQVIPCHQGRNTSSDSNPVYELSPGDGHAYASLFDLRAAKIRHVMLDLPARWKDGLVVLASSASSSSLRRDGLVVVLYENATLASVLRSIRRVTGWSYDCPSSATTGADGKSRIQSRPPGLSPPLSLEDIYWDFVTSHLDWEAERMLGYDNATWSGADRLTGS
jgi:hypothetical protein